MSLALILMSFCWQPLGGVVWSVADLPHPLFVGWLFAFRAAPTMTISQLVFAIATTVRTCPRRSPSRAAVMTGAMSRFAPEADHRQMTGPLSLDYGPPRTDNNEKRSRVNDAYWHATRSELKSIRRRGDVVVLIGAAALLSLIFLYREHSRELSAWLIAAGLLLAVIVASLWFVTSRTRRLAIARGLKCSHCSYMPHDTEIDDVASTRKCPHCEQSLDA